MLVPSRHPGSAHVIVLGNEKGGSGKSTVAFHVAVALLKAGQRVATIDLDCRQQTLTHYVDNRRAGAARAGVALDMPIHYCIGGGDTMQVAENENVEFQRFADAVGALEANCDFLIIDTPGTNNYLMRLAHSMADTLITPLNDSLIDFDMIGILDPVTQAINGVGRYGEMVREARRARRLVDGATSDWIVVRNRRPIVGTGKRRLVADRLKELSKELGFRPIDGPPERAVYSELFLQGLTALDDLDTTILGPQWQLASLRAREETAVLLRHLKLPLDERGRRRAANRAEWFSQIEKPLQMHDILNV